MKLGISSYTYPWAIGVPEDPPRNPLTHAQLLEKARELAVGLVQFGPNLPLERLPEKDLRKLVNQAKAWKIDLEMATTGIDPVYLREQIRFAKRNGLILLKTTPELADGQIPSRTELTNRLKIIVDELGAEKIGLAIDNSRMAAAELNEILESIRSPWLGAALDTANPLALPQGWQVSVRVLGHRTLSLHIKDFIVQQEANGMGFTIKGCPAGKGRLNVPWIVESFAALRIQPSAILESWTPRQATLDETLALEHAWAVQGVEYLRHYIAD